MRTFNHLTQEERYHIYIEHKKKVSLGDIAKDMGRNKSTLSRDCDEIRATAVIVTSRHKSRLSDVIWISPKRSSWMKL